MYFLMNENARGAEQQIDLKLTAYLSNFLRRKWALGDNRDFNAAAPHTHKHPPSSMVNCVGMK
jgi:hypothetical protein